VPLLHVFSQLIKLHNELVTEVQRQRIVKNALEAEVNGELELLRVHEVIFGLSDESELYLLGKDTDFLAELALACQV
jgi:hypothetical protein